MAFKVDLVKVGQWMWVGCLQVAGWRPLRGEAALTQTIVAGILRGECKCLVIESYSRFPVSPSLSLTLCRPLKLCRPKTANKITSSCFSLAFSSKLYPSSSVPLFPSLPRLICHCGLIISACSLYSFQPANLPFLVSVTVEAKSCPGLSSWFRTVTALPKPQITPRHSCVPSGFTHNSSRHKFCSFFNMKSSRGHIKWVQWYTTLFWPIWVSLCLAVLKLTKFRNRTPNKC